jgi:hypothetical protein
MSATGSGHPTSGRIVVAVVVMIPGLSAAGLAVAMPVSPVAARVSLSSIEGDDLIRCASFACSRGIRAAQLGRLR